MCGIYGTTRHYSDEIINDKVRQTKFRGPNNTGIQRVNMQYGEVILSHNRLSIIDVDKRSNQPFTFQNIIAVFNGEVYNFQELKKQYLSDIQFLTTSDTEVLCAMYSKFGTDCLKYINGAFAFVICDLQKSILFGARDRLGEKPLYYHNSSKGFEFASQLFPLCIGNKYTIDDFARQCYFSLQYIPDPQSIVQEVKKIKAGEYFVYDLKTKQLFIDKYWDIHYNSCGYVQPESYKDALEQVDGLLLDSIEKRLIADVPIGTFLSGGIDSSLVSAYVSKLNPSLETFSVGFEESDFDESFYSKSVAEILGVRHNHILCTAKQAIDVIDGLQTYYDEPMGDASAIPTSLLAQVTKQYVDVALSGDGGDEMFWGYGRYLKYKNRQWVYNIPKFIRSMAASGLDSMGKKRMALSLRLNNIQELYMNRRSYYEAERFDATKLQQSISDCSYLYENKLLYQAFSDFDIKTLMNYAYNTKIDRASMRSSLEVRCPFLDYRLVEYSRLLPLEYLYDKQIGQKRILRDLLYRDCNRELFERPKSGFAVPLKHWFRKELKDMLLDTINAETIKQIPDFDVEKLLQVRDKHLAGIENNTTILWLVMNYIMWYKLFDSLK